MWGLSTTRIWLLSALLLAPGGLANAQTSQPEERVVSEHGAWQVRCVEGSTRPCFMVQTADDGDGNAIVEFSIVRFQKSESGVLAGASAIVPLGTALPEGLALQIDQGDVLTFAYDFCTRGGCVSNLALTEIQVQAMKAGNLASVTITPALRPDQQITLTISLIGFTSAFDSLVATER